MNTINEFNSKPLNDILKRPVDLDENGIYNYTTPSETQKYFESFAKSDGNPNHSIGYESLKLTAPKSPVIMGQIIDLLKMRLSEDAIVIEIGGGSSTQGRSGKGYLAFKNYYPLDISYPHVAAFTKTYNRIGVVASAETLPFKDNSVDCIYTNAFLEHPINPDKVVEEIARVIKPGGYIVHNDAWFCRWWQRYGVYKIKLSKEMTLKEKIINLGAGISEIQLFRIPPIILRRAIRHFFKQKVDKLTFKRLKPNYALFLGCDEDAASSIDPVDAIRFYESKGFELIKKLTTKERLFHPNKHILLVKK